MLIRMKLTFDEIKSIIGINYIEHTKEILTSPPRVYEVVDINASSESILPSNRLVDITNDDNTMRTNLTRQTKIEEVKFHKIISL